MEKFAWLPVVVTTWRPSGSKALIWMQRYYIKGGSPFVALNGDSPVGEKYCLKLGILSYEF